MMTKGVILLAHDNEVFPYHRIAIASAWFIKKHMGIKPMLITDSETLKRIEKRMGYEQLFSTTTVVETESNTDRNYNNQNGKEDGTMGSFFNSTRNHVYNITPYDETLVLDTDYLVLNDQLNNVWESETPLRMNRKIDSIIPSSYHTDVRLHPMGIKQYWATVMYFRKSKESELFFTIIDYVKKNYEHFAKLYRFAPHLYRNDFVISVAVHLMNGSVGEHFPQSVVQPLPDGELMFAWDHQPIMKIGEDRAWFATWCSENVSNNIVALVANRSVHVMNKRSYLSVVEPWVQNQIEMGNV